MTHTIGIDIGSGAVKTVLFAFGDGGAPRWLAKRCERIRRRDPMTLAEEGRDGVLADAGLAAGGRRLRRHHRRGRERQVRDRPLLLA